LLMAPLLKKEGMPFGESLSAIVVNKMTSVFLTGMLALAGAYLYLGKKALFFLLAGGVIGAAVMIIGFSSFVRGFVKKKILKSYAAYFKGFSKNVFWMLRKRIYAVLLNTFLTCIKILVGGLFPWLLFLALGVDANFWELVVVFNTATLLSFVPFTLSGLGLREGAVWAMLGVLGLPKEQTGVAILLMTLVTYALGLAIMMGLKHEGWNLRGKWQAGNGRDKQENFKNNNKS
ncbi:flippase-like domain-containing protein, partial [Candidatus Woesearchaeota archaeon]|nr:flippase-like domain-containing protein [Candidatus Woesearchaeota archaeon]